MTSITWALRPSRAMELFNVYPDHVLFDQSHTICAVCSQHNCNLRTHRTYLTRNQPRRPRKPDQSMLMGTPFAFSYAFNPLAVAMHSLCGQLELHSLPRVLGDNTSLSYSLHTFITDGISRNIPFTDPFGTYDVAAQWLMAAAVDDLACTSTLVLWTVIESRRTNDRELDRFGTTLTTHFLKLLRERVECGEKISPGTIFAASNHLATCLMYFDQTDQQKETLIRGLEALVVQSGGIDHIDAAQTGLLQSLLWTDVLHAWNTGARPRFRTRPPPPTPITLMTDLRVSSYIPFSYLQCCGPDVMSSAKTLRFFLLFRHSNEVRMLTKVEYEYMVELERYTHVQLLEQQARYHLSDSIDECIILAMAIVRMTILCVWDQHVQIRRTHVRRLDRALRSVPHETWMKDATLFPLIWICWVMLAQTETCYDQEMVLRLISMPLKIVLGGDCRRWPTDWAQGFSSTFMPLLWHADYIPAVERVAHLIWAYLSRHESQ